MINMKSHMGFQLTPRSITLDDLEPLSVQIFEIFQILTRWRWRLP